MPNKINSLFFLSLQVQTGELHYTNMGFFLVFDKGRAFIKYQGPTDAKSSLTESIQQCLAQRVTNITVEMPAKEAESKDLFDVLSKLQAVLVKRSESLKIKCQPGAAKAKLVSDLLGLGCEIAPEEQDLVEAEVQKLRERQNSTQERARKMLEELKANQKKHNEFGIDFSQLYKAADFQAWPEISEQVEKVKATLEIELRAKEKLEREKKLYTGRIAHLRKVTDVGASEAMDLVKMQQKESELKSYNAEISELTNRLIEAQDQARKSEVAARTEIARCQKEYGPIVERLTKDMEGHKKK